MEFFQRLFEEKFTGLKSYKNSNVHGGINTIVNYFSKDATLVHTRLHRMNPLFFKYRQTKGTPNLSCYHGYRKDKQVTVFYIQALFSCPTTAGCHNEEKIHPSYTNQLQKGYNRID